MTGSTEKILYSSEYIYRKIKSEFFVKLLRVLRTKEIIYVPYKGLFALLLSLLLLV